MHIETELSLRDDGASVDVFDVAHRPRELAVDLVPTGLHATRRRQSLTPPSPGRQETGQRDWLSTLSRV